MNDQQPGYLILGGSGGIGAETARRLTRTGDRVFLAARGEAALQALAAEINAEYQTVDARSMDQVIAVARQAADAFGGLDGIVCCVGTLLLKPAHLTTEDEWQETLASNLTVAFATVRAAYETMRGSGGSVVLMTTSAARVGLPNHEAIAAAKAGVIGLMQSAAASYAARGIRFNAVAPGLIKTGLTERIWRDERHAEASRALHPLGRLGETGDVASMIHWLLGPENNWITGQVFGVDGGLATLKTSRA